MTVLFMSFIKNADIFFELVFLFYDLKIKNKKKHFLFFGLKRLQLMFNLNQKVKIFGDVTKCFTV